MPVAAACLCVQRLLFCGYPEPAQYRTRDPTSPKCFNGSTRSSSPIAGSLPDAEDGNILEGASLALLSHHSDVFPIGSQSEPKGGVHVK